MNRRKEENIRVKKSIVTALFSLMSQKSLADIHITELVSRAGVARASFYRNYCSKEDVLVTLIQDVLDAFGERMDLSQGSFYVYENVLLSFQIFQKYRDYVLDLYRSGYITVLVEEINHFHENIEGTMASSSIQKYRLYAYTGALMNTALTWLSGRDTTSPEDMAEFFLEMIWHIPNESART